MIQSYSSLVLARAARTCWWLAIAGCTHAAPAVEAPAAPEPPHAQLAEAEPPLLPPYRNDELARAIASEQAELDRAAQAIATREDDPAPDDALPGALADLAVRRRFEAALETCRDTGQRCPPRLDDPAWSYDVDGLADPPIQAALRYDRDDWRKIAAELHGRACACRTRTCVDSVEVAIAVLEQRPMPEVTSDDEAASSIVAARECLSYLRATR